MRRRDFLTTTGAAFAAMNFLPKGAIAGGKLAGSKPNIVLIMPDDISYGSIQAYGGAKPSPNVETRRRGLLTDISSNKKAHGSQAMTLS